MRCYSTCLPAHWIVPNGQKFPSTVFAITLSIRETMVGRTFSLSAESTEQVLHIRAAPTPLDIPWRDVYRLVAQFSATLITAGIFESKRQIKPCWRS